MSETLAIASGKGGVGKTTISVNLSLTQARSSNCLLLDADMGMANAHILLGINPKTSVRDVIEGSLSLENAIVKGPNNIQFLSGGSGITELLSIDKKKKFNFIRSFDILSNKVDHLFVDVSAGADEMALNMISASDKILIVLVNEPTSFMDAFTLIKACNLELKFKEFCIITNMVNSEHQGKLVFEKFKEIVTKFYDVNLNHVGSLLNIKEIKDSVLKKQPIVLNKKNKSIISLFNRLSTNINNASKNRHNGIKFFNNTEN